MMFEMLIFLKEETKVKIKKNKNIFLVFGSHKGLILVLHIFITDEKSWLRSSLLKLVC